MGLSELPSLSTFDVCHSASLSSMLADDRFVVQFHLGHAYIRMRSRLLG